MGYEIRTVGAEDWAELKELRLAALRDPVARVAFVDTFERQAVRSEAFWRGRATPVAEGGDATSLIASGPDGAWVAMLVLLDETGPSMTADGEKAADRGVPPQIHVVSVYVRPGHRGTGVAEQLFRGATAWAWEHTKAERVRLWVHGDNARAQAFYRRLGFVRTGATMAFPPIPEETEYEMVLLRP
ncbi:GNAT family N-acetyltransferase [Streptomyces sp. NPDC002055]|uniref:GNAT family N-acetyltransferase n=1 Tax=Streptomyces sp. NPDC002055 TaxID=3154534 RepID=UPI003331565A